MLEHFGKVKVPSLLNLKLNQPSYLENFIHLFIKVTLQEFRIYAQIDTNLNKESSITEREKGILRFNGI